MKYPNVEAYVKAHGYKMTDLTPNEVKDATEEMEAINAGYEILDGLFSRPLKKDLIVALPNDADIINNDIPMTNESISPEAQFELEKQEFLKKYPDAPESEDIECLNLIMRKEYAEQILRGEKKVEVRDYSDHYYNRLFDKKVMAWADAKTDEMASKGVPEDEVNAFVQDSIDFLSPLRQVKKIHFHNYDNSWFLDVECVSNYQLSVVREQVEEVQELFDCHEFDELLEDLEKQNAQERPMFFYFVLGDVIDTNLK